MCLIFRTITTQLCLLHYVEVANTISPNFSRSVIVDIVHQYLVSDMEKEMKTKRIEGYVYPQIQDSLQVRRQNIAAVTGPLDIALALLACPQIKKRLRLLMKRNMAVLNYRSFCRPI